jgi:hypothetical protein
MLQSYQTVITARLYAKLYQTVITARLYATVISNCHYCQAVCYSHIKLSLLPGCMLQSYQTVITAGLYATVISNCHYCRAVCYSHIKLPLLPGCMLQSQQTVIPSCVFIQFPTNVFVSYNTVPPNRVAALRRLTDHSADDRKPIIQTAVFPLHVPSIGKQSMIDSTQAQGVVSVCISACRASDCITSAW